MNEPKRRGRPPKAQGLAALVGLPSTTPEEFLGEKLDEAIGDVLRDKLAQAFALRVWNGQSRDLPRRIRIERVKSALDKQNLPFEGVQLP